MIAIEAIISAKGSFRQKYKYFERKSTVGRGLALGESCVDVWCVFGGIGIASVLFDTLLTKRRSMTNKTITLFISSCSPRTPQHFLAHSDHF